jgi:hypothetical protein
MASLSRALIGGCIAFAAYAFAASPAPFHAQGAPAPGSLAGATSENALVRSLPGFKRGHARVNGIRLHYVEGGKGRR